MFASLTIPDDPADWPDWLERQLVGLHLNEIVEELPILTGIVGAPNCSLEDILGDQRQDVLDAGLFCLSSSQVNQFVKNPHLLLELQEQVLMHGGEYWDSVVVSDEQAKLEHDQRAEIFKTLGIDSADSDVTSQPAAPSREQFNPKSLIATVLALSLLLGAFWVFIRPAPTGWGFNQSGLLTADVDAKTYLETLADAAEQWSQKRPETKDALATRLQQFSNGCQTLIEAEHPQLSRTDREWLIEKCQAWKDKIDQQLATLQSGEQSVLEVRSATDEIVENLVKALRERQATV